jgi:hypothetical protein
MSLANAICSEARQDRLDSLVVVTSEHSTPVEYATTRSDILQQPVWSRIQRFGYSLKISQPNLPLTTLQLTDVILADSRMCGEVYLSPASCLPKVLDSFSKPNTNICCHPSSIAISPFPNPSIQEF